MKHALLAAAFSSTVCFAGPPPERPNQPVFRSGPWIVVRTVRADKDVQCTGHYRANSHVQLTKDRLVLQTPEEVSGVSFAFDGQEPSAIRPISASEKELKSVVFTGEEFATLVKSRKLRVDTATAQGVMRHDLELDGLPAALENIHAGCPVQSAPSKGKPRAKSSRERR
jgi:hypothetical protein